MKLPDLTPMLQPDTTGVCGQTCVAMIAGCTLHEAVAACGVSTLYEPGTSTTALVRGLQKLGVQVGEWKKLKLKGRGALVDLPEFALMTVAANKGVWAHSVVLKDGFVYDPGIGFPFPVQIYESFIIAGAYSRRYRKAKDGGKRVRAYWYEVLPILGVPEKKSQS